MEYNWLKDFLALAEHGTFSRAADARHMTQPAFSRRIRGLEDWLGTRLFDRTAQGAVLTSGGDAFRPHAESLMRQIERAREAVRMAGEAKASSLAIAATHALSFTFFPTFIRGHLDLAGLGSVNLVSDSYQACEENLFSGEVHFLLCHYRQEMAGRLDPTQIESIPVGHDTLVALSAPDASGNPIWPLGGSSTDGRPTRVLSYSPASGLGRILSAHSSGVGDVDRPFTSHLAATLRTMALEGHGVAWLPLTLVQDDIAQGRLVRAGGTKFDVPVEIRIFRSVENRNRAADALWGKLTSPPGGA